jgi:DNA repair exonuclease SbcCD nuclease subunit
MNIIIYGDQHLDLKTEGIDRTDDILDAHSQITDYAIDLNNDGEEVIVLNMGDMFHGTRPRSEVIAKAIGMLNVLEKEEIETYIIAGNHDIIDQKDKTSALAPLEAIGYAYISIYHAIEVVNLRKGLNLITVPHISKAKAVAEGYKNAQDYIDSKSSEIEEELDEDDINIVIGHMNIGGAKTGTESYMIKGSHEDFPKVLKESEKIDYIFNGHIHRPQVIPNPDGAPIVITGDIQTNDFGERLDTKVFFHLELDI